MRKTNKDKRKKRERKEYNIPQHSIRKKPCKFCVDKVLTMDVKDYNQLQNYITERGKILPRRYSGNCAKHQRRLTKVIKHARILGILPFTVD